MDLSSMWVSRWQGLVDLAAVPIAIYLLLVWAREARALRFGLGIRVERVAPEVIQVELVRH
jgi:hypothetical protein